MEKKVELKECDHIARCAVCDKFTEWRMIIADFHVCPGDCYRRVEASGLFEAIGVLQEEGRLPLDIQCQPVPTLH